MTDLAERRGLDTDVYEPAEDSALLRSVAIEEIGSDDLVVDVGTGSGYVGSGLSKAGGRVVGTDVNPHACQRARDEGIEAIRADLVAPFRAGVVDVAIFNPPYLPTEVDTRVSDWIEVALSGGETGRAVIERFIDDVGRVLTPDGFVLLLVSTYTGVDAVVEYAGDRGFSAIALADESYPGETLSVLKLVR